MVYVPGTWQKAGKTGMWCVTSKASVFPNITGIYSQHIVSRGFHVDSLLTTTVARERESCTQIPPEIGARKRSMSIGTAMKFSLLSILQL